MQVRVEKTEITRMAVDAVVNPANSRGIMDSGIAADLRREGGDEIQTAAMEAAPIAVGAAIVTGAGSLPARHVIHAPTMAEPGLKIGAEHVRRAARAALIAADIKRFQSIAFPLMGADSGGLDAAEAARAIVEEIRAHKRSFPETVLLIGASDEMVATFEEALQNAQFGL